MTKRKKIITEALSIDDAMKLFYNARKWPVRIMAFKALYTHYKGKEDVLIRAMNLMQAHVKVYLALYDIIIKKPEIQNLPFQKAREYAIATAKVQTGND